MARVTFLPDEITVDIADGDLLLDAAIAADLHLDSSCGGDGTCGGCLLMIESGEVDGGTGPKLTEEQKQQGRVLACTARASGDIVVHIPPSSRLGRLGASGPDEVQALHKRLYARVGPEQTVPPVRKVALSVPEPSLSDTASDMRRVRRALAMEHGLTEVESAWPAVKKAAAALRKSGWRVTALVQDDGCATRILDIEPGDTCERQYGIAVDLGTTTVVGHLVDLTDGKVLSHHLEYNRQSPHGADVISRIIHAGTADGLRRFQELAAESIRIVSEHMIAEAGIDGCDVIAYTVAGNTTMTQLLFGLDPASIRTEPYIPTLNVFPWTRARELGLPGADEARLYAFPCAAGYVGGDITSGILAADMPSSEELLLLIDIGTNGEMVLGNSEWMVACSCSAGPAFEGGSVLHGMRASEGAIEEVRIAQGTFEPEVKTIGDLSPMGICGSGLVDALAELMLSGAIDRRGTFRQDAGSPRIRRGSHGWEYVLVTAGESGTGGDIVITESDITNLINAKAAVHAGIRVLLESVDVSIDDVDRVLIAGSFGRYLDLERVVTIGLMPDIDRERFQFIGNGSLGGATMALTASDVPREAVQVAENITYMELSVDPGFMDKYVSALFLPHTDEHLFPSVASMLDERKVGHHG